MRKRRETHKPVSLEPDKDQAARGGAHGDDEPVYGVEGDEEPRAQEDDANAKGDAAGEADGGDGAEARELEGAEGASEGEEDEDDRGEEAVWWGL